MVALLDVNLTPDKKMGEITEQPKIGKLIQEVQREEEIGGHSVAMGLDIDRDPRLLTQPLPAFKQRETVLDAT